MIPNALITPVYGIVPAAGLGLRMGRAKQTLPFRGSTMVGSVARTLLDAGLDAIVVVTRSELIPGLGLPIDKKLSVAVNDDASSQMIDSIRIGLSALFDDRVVSSGEKLVKPSRVDRTSDCTGILVVPGDMPELALTTYRLCVAAFRREPTKIIVAAQNGRRGHPLVFPAALRHVVRQLGGGLNALLDLHRDRVRLVETGDPAALEDVDTWDQFRSLSPAPDHRGNDNIRKLSTGYGNRQEIRRAATRRAWRQQ